MRVTRIEPVAQPKAGKNVFLVRSEFTADVGAWCRPGMSGLAKVDSGKRRIFWILTHRTMDYLRLHLWWW